MSRAGDRLVNILLIAASVSIGFVVCEIGYRAVLEWRETIKWRTPRAFSAYSTSVWEFDPSVGYRYRAHARMDVAFLAGGTVRWCGTFVTGVEGSPGKGINRGEPTSARFIVLGDSFTAQVDQEETWPDILGRLLRDGSDRGDSILNLARDGFSVLQMFDQAATLVRAGYRPQAIIVAIIGGDLVRPRMWRMTRERNGRTEVFTSTEPSTDVRPETHYRTVFVDPNVTRSWCEEARASGRPDETTKRLEAAFAATLRQDEEVFGIRLLSLTDCYICNALLRVSRSRGAATLANRDLPPHTLLRFQDDLRFRENIAVIRESGIPIWLVYLPYLPELQTAQKKLTPQENSLLASLGEVVDHQIDLTPAEPMGDSATALTLHPGDLHPSHAGMKYYAREIYRRM
jgi:hypothetical protein